MSTVNKKPINLCLSNTAYQILMKKAEEAKTSPSRFVDNLLREKAVTKAEMIYGVMNYGWSNNPRVD